MASKDPLRLSVCRACAAPTNAPPLCSACGEAFGLAARANPSTVSSVRSVGTPTEEPQSSDDLDLWDAWSLVGEGGSRSERSFAE